MALQCFSQRLLNPYRGITNTIRYQSAEAVTADGVKWDIYVSNDGLLEGLPYNRKTQVSDIRYGTWTEDTGLQRGPLYPSDDFKRLERMGDQVYEHLLEVYQQAPFPYEDRFELWLLDSEDRPLALIDSATQAADINLEQSLVWNPGILCRSTFTSAAANMIGIDSSRAGAVANYLAGYINSLTRDRASAQLFERRLDGRGFAVRDIRTMPGLENRLLPEDAFPSFMLRTGEHDRVHRRLIEDFFCWQAPWLLLLRNLDLETRRTYEQHARVQPLKIAGQYRLYPEIADRETIAAARVEARLRETMPEKHAGETSLPTFYIELRPEAAD
jgi:hypothetical protein